MPRPPNDSKQCRPAHTAKRIRRASTPRRTTSLASSGNAVAFPVADTPQMGVGTAPFLSEIQQAVDIRLSLTPLQLLAVIIKAKLGDRIKDEEVHLICQVYYTALMSIWDDDEE